MNQQHDTFAANLRNKYGIAQPMADITPDEEQVAVRSLLDELCDRLDIPLMTMRMQQQQHAFQAYHSSH